jgi:hypothetical protein
MFAMAEPDAHLSWTDHSESGEMSLVIFENLSHGWLQIVGNMEFDLQFD